MSENSAAAAGTVKLGDLEVNRMGFGAMRITGDGIWGEPRDHDEAIRVLRRAVELGVNFIDTADAYGPEISELLIAEALQPYPKGLVIATKGGMVRSGPSLWQPDGRPEHIREAVEASLKRLGIQQIDVYQFHRPDPHVDFAKSLQAFIELKKQSKIRHIGVSNVSVDQLKLALELTEIVSVQNRYNIDDRENEAVLELCEQERIAFIPYFPIGGNLGGVEAAKLHELSQKYEATVRQIALAWLLARSPVMLPIPGTTSVKHLEENIAAASIKLTDADTQALTSST